MYSRNFVSLYKKKLAKKPRTQNAACIWWERLNSMYSRNFRFIVSPPPQKKKKIVGQKKKKTHTKCSLHLMRTIKQYKYKKIKERNLWTMEQLVSLYKKKLPPPKKKKQKTKKLAHKMQPAFNV